MIWLGLIIVFLIIINLYLFAQFPLHPMKQDTHYDVCIVLGSPCEADGTLSRVQRTRVDRAVELYKEHHVSHLLISGGSVANAYCEAECMGKLVLEKGVRSEDLYLEKKARNTYENLLFAKNICDEHDFHSVLVVTSRFHIRRASFFVAKFFRKYALAGTHPKEKWRHYLSEYFRMWNTLRIEFTLKHKK